MKRFFAHRPMLGFFIVAVAAAVVSTWLLNPQSGPWALVSGGMTWPMALKLAGTSNPNIVTVARIVSVSKFLKIDPKVIEREVRSTMERILGTWRGAVKDLPASKAVKDAIFDQWKTLALVKDVRPALVEGHDAGASAANDSSVATPSGR
jgi:hypothetical protein